MHVPFPPGDKVFTVSLSPVEVITGLEATQAQNGNKYHVNYNK